jgi:hypothetical protein
MKFVSHLGDPCYAQKKDLSCSNEPLFEIYLGKNHFFKEASEYSSNSSMSNFNMSSGKISTLTKSHSLSLVLDSALIGNSQIP